MTLERRIVTTRQGGRAPAAIARAEALLKRIADGIVDDWTAYTDGGETFPGDGFEVMSADKSAADLTHYQSVRRALADAIMELQQLTRNPEPGRRREDNMKRTLLRIDLLLSLCVRVLRAGVQGASAPDEQPPVVLRGEVVTVEARVKEGRLQERDLAFRDGTWIDVASTDPGQTLGPVSVATAQNTPLAGTVRNVSLSGGALVEEFAAGNTASSANSPSSATVLGFGLRRD